MCTRTDKTLDIAPVCRTLALKSQHPRVTIAKCIVCMRLCRELTLSLSCQLGKGGGGTSTVSPVVFFLSVAFCGGGECNPEKQKLTNVPIGLLEESILVVYLCN